MARSIRGDVTCKRLWTREWESSRRRDPQSIKRNQQDKFYNFLESLLYFLRLLSGDVITRLRITVSSSWYEQIVLCVDNPETRTLEELFLSQASEQRD